MARNYPKGFDEFVRSEARYVVGLFPPHSGKTWNAMKKASLSAGPVFFIAHYTHIDYHRKMVKKFNADGEIHLLTFDQFLGGRARGQCAQMLIFDEFDCMNIIDMKEVLWKIDAMIGNRFSPYYEKAQAVFLGTVMDAKAEIGSTDVTIDGMVVIQYEPKSNLLRLLGRLPKKQTEIIAIKPFIYDPGAQYGEKDDAYYARLNDGRTESSLKRKHVFNNSTNNVFGQISMPVNYEYTPIDRLYVRECYTYPYVSSRAISVTRNMLKLEDNN